MMDKKLVEKLSIEAGLGGYDEYVFNKVVNGEIVQVQDDCLEQFAALIAEECAKIAENTVEHENDGQASIADPDGGREFFAENAAQAIREAFKP